MCWGEIRVLVVIGVPHLSSPLILAGAVVGTSQHTDVIPFQAPLSHLASLKPWELSARTWEELTHPGATLHHRVRAVGDGSW